MVPDSLSVSSLTIFPSVMRTLGGEKSILEFPSILIKLFMVISPSKKVLKFIGVRTVLNLLYNLVFSPKTRWLTLNLSFNQIISSFYMEFNISKDKAIDHLSKTISLMFSSVMFSIWTDFPLVMSWPTLSSLTAGN